MSLSKIKNWVQREVGVAGNIPITHLVAPDIFETQDGQLGAVLKVKGVPYLTTEAESLKRYQQTMHHAVLQLGSEFMLMETVHRRFESTALSNKGFRNEFCQNLHDKYHRQFSDGLYVNDIYLTLIYKGDASRTNKQGVVNRLLSATNKLMDKTIINSRERARLIGMNLLNQKINQWMTALNSFGVARLGEHEEGYNELIAYLSLVPNGGRQVHLSSAAVYPIHAKTTQKLPATTHNYPQGHLGQYLANHRVFFGDAIQFQGNQLNDVRFGAMLSIKTYFRKTDNKCLDSLLALDCEFIRTQTFAPLELGASIDVIESAQNKKISSEDHAASQVEELNDLADLVASGKVSIGAHHHTLMVLSPSKEGLEQVVHHATQAYASAFIPVVRETMAQPISYYAQIPGNSRFIARSAPITSENLADFCSFHNSQSGYRNQCVLNEPITLVRTPQKTPVFWNCHKPGSPNNPTSGHGLIIGSNGAGKTAFACFLDSEMNRFAGHRTFILDRNEGAKIYILACNGTYLKLDPSSNQEFTMNPLQLPDTEDNREFCKTWMATLLLEEGEKGLDSHITETINEVINYGFDHLAPKDRTLSNIAPLFSIDFPRWPRLRRWLREQGTRAAGQYAWAFDNSHDSLNINADKTGMDITYLTDSVPSHISTPFYMYILHRFKLSLNGQITTFLFEEMWSSLKEPFWKEALEHYVPTIRKLFGHIIGLTQSPESIINSPINHVLLNNISFLAIFANPSAKEEIYINALNLTPTEFKLIKSHAADSRILLYKQEKESIICHIDLSAIRDELPVLSGNVNSVRKVDELRRQLGTDAKDWLPVFLEQSKCA
jgi:type IV secretion system protein VirB4